MRSITRKISRASRGASRLVEEEHARRGHQRSRDGEHLLLAPGERAGGLALTLAQDGEHRQRPLETGRDLARRCRVATDQEILEHGELGEDLAALGDVDEAGGDDPVGRPRRDVAALVVDAPSARTHEAGDHPQRRALPTPVGAEQRDDLSRADRERGILEGTTLAVGHRHAVELEQRRHYSGTPR